MIEELKTIEKDLLGYIQNNEWKYRLFPSRYGLRRTWTRIGNQFLALHIFPRQAVVEYHNHKWPMAAHILKGQYEMDLGISKKGEAKPEVDYTTILSSGSYYELPSSDLWHSMKTVDEVLTVCLMGPRFDGLDKNLTISPKEQDETPKILEIFRKLLNEKE